MKHPAKLYTQMDEYKTKCNLCSHHCIIKPDNYGFCGVRQNINGELFSMIYGDVIARNVDPIEKKPLYHFHPGSKAYSIATMGCNFHCDFCQNWQISQLSRSEYKSQNTYTKPNIIVDDAKRKNCKSIAYTYTEPTIFFEYAYDVATLAKQAGIDNVFVTNGYMTSEAIDTIAPFLDAANVDLKSFNDDFYQKTCQGKLQPVLSTIKELYKRDIWVEVTTLIVPEQNDTNEELTKIASFIADVSCDIPWHISRFHPDYQSTATQATPMETLQTAHDIGKEQGLHYVYMGNVQTEVNTTCPYCGKTLIHRSYFKANPTGLQYGKCLSCDKKIAGRYS